MARGKDGDWNSSVFWGLPLKAKCLPSRARTPKPEKKPRQKDIRNFGGRFPVMDLSQYWSVCDAVWARKHIAVCSAGWASNRFLKPVSRTGFFENRFFWVLFVQYGALLARVDLHEFLFLGLLVGMIKHANSCRLLWFAKLYPPLPREKIFFTCPGERYYWKMTLFYDENSPSWSNNC